MGATIPPQIVTGWLGIDSSQRACAGPFQGLAAAAPHLMGDTPTSPVLLYKAWREVLGKDPDYPAQQIGDCVSFGHGHANDLLQCVEISLGEAAEFRETDTEFIYGTSREAAGILGRGDGSYGAAAVKAMTTVGVVSREMLGADGAYSGGRARAWGRAGVPEAIKRQAAPYKLGSAALVSSWDELVAALVNGYPVTICSNQGFSLHRDRDGFCPAQGVWGHCMLIAGVRFDRPGACILQSWGPDTPDGPTALDQPTFSFWADRRVVERILAAGDSWALSRAAAFVSRPLPPRWGYNLAA
ncbi:hypothetical protein OJF2_72700 [Aquisphaera giovannonii]|uniref:Peptidase C1A papain C-terminal domain-containing protein n=1 Tax=Aquisphaera giovannonii TaxID=406548 RepID=A0A5B9WEM0_9BACT|nr:hypothetical protein [Aquisphaera giovannonii]QEH38664.1 hypothetical protein OJF2_72700 [Aquisphaera giovannonii]